MNSVSEGFAWYKELDLSKIDDEDRYRLLEHVVEKIGRHRVQEALSISRSNMWRLLKRQIRLNDDKLRIILDFLSPEELQDVLGSRRLLESLGIIRRDGTVNYPIIIEILKEASSDEYLKQLIIRFVVENFREDLKRFMGYSVMNIELRWSEDFEKWLTERKSKPISKRTLRDYKSVFTDCLEGRRLSNELLKQLEKRIIICNSGKERSTSWIRQILRHYVRYLYAFGQLDWDDYSRLLLVIPGRRYGRKLSQKPIRADDVLKTIKTLRERRPDIYTLYLIILFSGIRFEHVLNALKTWSPDEELYVSYLSRNIKRLECLETHCKYYLGKERDIKPAGFMFFPRNLLQLIEEYRNKIPNKRRIEKVAIDKLGLLPPSLIRTFALREMKNALGDNDVYRFIVGKFGELTVSARHYMDLLKEADNVYVKYMMHIRTLGLF